MVAQIQEQLWGAVRRAWISIARAAAAAGLGAFALGELGGILLNGGHLTVFVHLMSLVLGLIAAYGVAVTVAVFQAVRGIFAAIGDVETELGAAMRGAGQVIDAQPR